MPSKTGIFRQPLTRYIRKDTDRHIRKERIPKLIEGRVQLAIYHFDWKYIPARTGINFLILPACELNPAPENYTRLYLTHTEMQQKQHKTAKLNIPTHFHIDKGLCVMYLSLLRARLLLP